MEKTKLEAENKKISPLDFLVKLIYIFASFSFAGWIYEVTLAFIYGAGFVNRGFLFGPFLPVYGFGGIILYLALGKLLKKRIGKFNMAPILFFVGIVVIATTVELVAGLIIDQVLTERLWDYSHYSFNFKGIIALNPSIRFGLTGMLMFYVIYPILEKFLDKLSPKTRRYIALALLVYLLADFALTLILK